MTDTRTSPITADVIREAIDGIDSVVNCVLRTGYVGRGMTRPCVGVIVESPRDLLALGASIAYVVAANAHDPDDAGAQADAIDDAIDPLRRAEIDSMGRDLIVYWPGVTADTEEPQP